MVDDGKFVVNSWWIDGETWCVDGHFSSTKNLSLFEYLFFEREGLRFSESSALRSVAEGGGSPVRCGGGAVSVILS